MDGVGGVDVAAPLTWHDFLERMRHPSAADFVKSIKSFIVSFTNKAPNPERDSSAVQEFITNMEGAFRVHSLWTGCSEEELESAGEGLEKYVMTKLFNRTFASLPEERKHDEELYEKMSCIQQFIRPENLDIKPNFQNETSWLLAQKELQKINMYKAPRDKLVCILNCCKVINNLLLNASFTSSENPPGADEFLPVLIYVTIKANPPQLHSNLLYIQRYRCQTRLVSETAYYFTNILSAESFIWNIDAQALSIDEIEFQNNMESARTVLLGMSTDVEGEAVPNAHDAKSPSSSEIQDDGRDRMIIKDSGSSQSIRGKHGQHQSSDYSRELDGKSASTTYEQSVSALVSKGANNLLKEEQLSKYFIEYPFIYASAGDLTVKDVEALLNSYKQLVLKYVSLSKGMGNVNPSLPLFSADKLADTEKSKEQNDENGKEPDDVKGTNSEEHVDGDVVENSIGNTLEEVDNIAYNIHMVEPSKDTSEKSEHSV